jgi:hypothetical protein
MQPTPRSLTSGLRLAALAALATALTTLAIHLLPHAWSELRGFEGRLALHSHPVFLNHQWIVLAHCLLVVISMGGVAAARWHRRPVLLAAGLAGFGLFAACEMLRTALSIFALNRAWRAGYAMAGDDAARERFRTLIQGFSGIDEALFFLFLLAFTLGTLCFGLAFVGAAGGDRWIGWLFLAWTALNLPGLADTLAGSALLSPFFAWVGPGFQPLARTALGLWLWRAAERPPGSPSSASPTAP